MIGHRSPISGIAAHGGRLVATAGYDNQVILWDALHHRPVARSVHDHLANQVAFSPDGRWLVSASSDHSARVWSVPDLKLHAVLAQHRDDVEMAVFHPHRDSVATASRDGSVRVFDACGALRMQFDGHGADVISVAWSHDGRHLLSSSDDGTVKRWSLDSGSLVDDIDLGGVETDTIAIGGDGVIYAGNDAGAIVTIDGAEIRSHAGHAAGIKRLVHHPAAGLLVSLSYDRTLRIWSTAGGGLTGRATATLPPEVWPRACAFVDAERLAFATFGSTYALHAVGTSGWDLAAVRPTPGINALALHQGRRVTVGDSGRVRIDGQEATGLGSLCNFLVSVGPRLLTGGQAGVLMDALTGEALLRHRSPLNCAAAFLRDGIPHAVVGTYTGEGLVVAVAADGAVRRVATLALHANAVKSLAAAGRQLFSVCADTSAAWFGALDFSELARVPRAHDRIANGCAAWRDGRFASVGRDRRLRLWDGPRATVVETPHLHSIKCLAASSDGQLLASGCYGGRVAVYDLVRSEWTRVERPTVAGISSVVVEDARHRVVAASYDGQVYDIAL